MTCHSMLIVDDDENVREALSRWFSTRGFDVTTAVDGLDALGKCETGEYDLITLDLEMPRLGGLDAIGPIRELQPHSTVVVLTGYAQDADEAKARGAVKVLMKPMRLTQLEDELRDAMEISAQRNAVARP